MYIVSIKGILSNDIYSAKQHHIALTLAIFMLRVIFEASHISSGQIPVFTN